jgi:arylsulfatase A-like enzyme
MSSAVIDGDWKLIHWFNDDLFELFNLKEDKAEQQNLAAKYPERVKTLKSILDTRLKETNAQYRKPGKKMKWDLQ